MAAGSDVIKNQLHRSVLHLVSLERARKDDSENIYMFMSSSIRFRDIRPNVKWSGAAPFSFFLFLKIESCVTYRGKGNFIRMTKMQLESRYLDHEGR